MTGKYQPKRNRETGSFFDVGMEVVICIRSAILQGNRYLIIRSKCEEYIISCLKTALINKALCKLRSADFYSGKIRR